MRQKPNSCLGCSCYSHGTDFSQVEGTGSLGVLICAESSGELEARDQLPLRPYAPAGSLLERTFRRMGYSRAQFSLTNCLRCRPRNNWLSGAPWEWSALTHCRPNLDAAIRDRRPRAILALGDTATRELTGEAGEARGVSHLCGYVLPTYQTVPEPCTESDCVIAGAARPDCFMCGGTGISGTKNAPAQNPIAVIPTYHPSFIRRGAAHLQGIFARNLQRAVNVAAGRDRLWQWGIDPERSETYANLRYQMHPSLDEAISFVSRVRASSGSCLSYDIETYESASLDEDARDGFTDTSIRLVQFSLTSGEGIALPWEGRYRELARDILRADNVKCGHNLWLFDNKVLAAVGARESLDLTPRGTIHDTLQMFHHWQPDLPAHLQFCAQFVQFPFPWKHLAATNLEFYGCVDVDATLRLYTFLDTALRKDGIYDSPYDVHGDCVGGYIGQVAQVRPILAAMERRGLPVDDAERLKLDGEFDLAQQELDVELQRRVPEEVLGLEPRRGKKGSYSYGYINAPKELQGLVEREFKESAIDAAGEPITTTVRRWCRLIPFNANSGPQLLRYMDAKGNKRPKSRETDDEGEEKDTTGKKELVRLAHRTGDDFYLRVIEYRELGKMRGTYINGFVPHADGCVHTTFTFDTGIGQLSSRNPNIQNFPKHGRLARATRRMIKAPDGYLFAEWDYKSCHVLTLGFLAEDETYIRFARIDMHSIMTGHFLKLWRAQDLVRESDDEIRARCRWLKSNEEYKHIRDSKIKHAGLGIGNGLKAKGLFERYMEFFTGQKEAASILADYEEVYPKIFAFQRLVQQEAHDQQYQKTQFGHIRRFYEVFRWDYKKAAYSHGDQAEEAISYKLSNIAFGYIREHMKILERLGINERYNLVNCIHDSLLYVIPEDSLEQHVADVYPVLVTPSQVLRHPTIAPEGLWIDAECNVGRDWSSMTEVDVKAVAVV